MVGPGVKGGPCGKHPSLTDLTDGDLKYHTDFRRVYATLLDDWLGVDSKMVLGDKFEPLKLPEEGLTVRAFAGIAKPHGRTAVGFPIFRSHPRPGRLGGVTDLRR